MQLVVEPQVLIVRLHLELEMAVHVHIVAVPRVAAIAVRIRHGIQSRAAAVLAMANGAGGLRRSFDRLRTSVFSVPSGLAHRQEELAVARAELTYDAFLVLAAQAGFDPADPHLEELFPDVQALFARIDALEALDPAGEEPALTFHAGGEGRTGEGA